MISAELDSEGMIRLQSDYPMRDRDRIKAIPGTRYRDDGWCVPVNWAACLQLRGIFGAELGLGPKLTNWATQYIEEIVAPGLELRKDMGAQDDDPVISSWRGKGKNDLYPFQEAGVKFLSIAGTAYLCDEMGTGKTAQTISAIRYLHQTGKPVFPALVIAPNSLTKNWIREINDWMPEATVSFITGSVAQRRAAMAVKADIYVANYSTARMHSRLTGYGSIRLRTCVVCDKTRTASTDVHDFPQSKCERCKKELNKIPWKTLVVDEAHRLKDPKSKQTRAVWAIRTDETKQVFCLSGTALTEAPQDLWAALRLIQPESFSNHSKYVDRYCDIGFNPFGGMEVKGLKVENKEEFFRIIDPFMRRMPKKAVLPFLPDKVYIRRDLDLTPAQKRQYTQLKKGMMAELIGGGFIVTDNILVQATRLDQIASACLEAGDEPDTYRMTHPSNKIDGLLEVLEDMNNKPLVVASASRQLIELAKVALAKAKISFTEVVGGQTDDQRDKAVRDFQAGAVRVIFCSTGAGSEGLTLTNADTMCFLQRPWKMSQSKQMEDRIHRIGAERHESITIIDLVSYGTIEDRRLKKLAEKGDNLEEIMRDIDFIKYLLEGDDDE